jgi:Tol biopolymer transport system component
MSNEVAPNQSASKRNLIKNRKIVIVIVIMVFSTCLLSLLAVNYYFTWAGDSRMPAWSPDGRFIAYKFDNLLFSHIIVMDSDGENKRIVARCEGAKSPVWSPDSTKIAFNCIIGYGPAPLYTRYYSIVIVGADGSNRTQLIYGNFSNHSQQWSPDGDAMVFVSNRDARDPSTMDPMNWDVYLYSFNSGNIARLTNSLFPNIHPAWSPEGTMIAYVLDTQGDGGTPVTVNGSEASGGLLRIINRKGDLLHELKGSGTSLSWSSDGSLISFSNGQRVYSIEVDSGKRTQLTPSDRNCCPRSPTFSPDGNRVAFSDNHDHDDDSEIYIVNIAEGSTFQLTSNETADAFPAWSPDGTEIAFQSEPDRGSRWQIYTIAPDGSKLNCLTCMLWD